MLEEMKKMIAEQLSCDENEINLETSFKDDLGADSLDLFELEWHWRMSITSRFLRRSLQILLP